MSLLSALEICSQEEGHKHDKHSQQSLQGEHMLVHDAGDDDAQGLPGGHDESEHDRTKLCDGVEDEELSCSRTDGHEQGVKAEFRVADEKRQRGEEHTSEDKGAHGEDAGEEVYAKHHLDGSEFVRAEQL